MVQSGNVILKRLRILRIPGKFPYMLRVAGRLPPYVIAFMYYGTGRPFWQKSPGGIAPLEIINKFARPTAITSNSHLHYTHAITTGGLRYKYVRFFARRPLYRRGDSNDLYAGGALSFLYAESQEGRFRKKRQYRCISGASGNVLDLKRGNKAKAPNAKIENAKPPHARNKRRNQNRRRETAACAKRTPERKMEYAQPPRVRIE